MLQNIVIAGDNSGAAVESKFSDPIWVGRAFSVTNKRDFVALSIVCDRNHSEGNPVGDALIQPYFQSAPEPSSSPRRRQLEIRLLHQFRNLQRRRRDPSLRRTLKLKHRWVSKFPQARADQKRNSDREPRADDRGDLDANDKQGLPRIE